MHGATATGGATDDALTAPRRIVSGELRVLMRDDGDRTVAFAGDWHSSIVWAQSAIPALARRGIRTVFHVGDFGLWRRHDPFVDAVEFWCVTAGVTIWVTLGNHENYDVAEAYFGDRPDEPAQLREHIFLLPRVYRWSYGDRSFVSVGGAGSVDLDRRLPGLTWWPQEEIGAADVEKAVDGGHAEVMISHEAPVVGTAAVDRIRSEKNPPWSAAALAYAAVSARRLGEAVDAIRPDIHVHGHWHAADEVTFVDGRRVYSMGMNFQDRNLGLLNLKTMEWEWVVDSKLPGGPIRMSKA